MHQSWEGAQVVEALQVGLLVQYAEGALNSWNCQISEEGDLSDPLAGIEVVLLV